MADPFNPFNSLAPGLTPNPPGEIPSAPAVGDATVTMSPFKEALDIDAIIKNLTLDRPLKMQIPNRDKYPDWEFHIINSIPAEFADAHNKGFKEVTDPELAGLFAELVAGTDKTGKAFRPVLVARPKAVGNYVRERQRIQLRSLYAGMDPKNKDLAALSKYAKNVDARGGTEGDFSGRAWNINVAGGRLK